MENQKDKMEVNKNNNLKEDEKQEQQEKLISMYWPQKVGQINLTY